MYLLLHSTTMYEHQVYTGFTSHNITKLHSSCVSTQFCCVVSEAVITRWSADLLHRGSVFFTIALFQIFFVRGADDVGTGTRDRITMGYKMLDNYSNFHFNCSSRDCLGELLGFVAPGQRERCL